MYRIVIYQTTGTDTAQTQLFTPSDIVVERWSKRINAPGKLVFSMHRFNSKATETNLRKYRRVRLYRKSREDGEYESAWFGYIEATREVGDRLEVVCSGMLDLFRKRFTADGEIFDGQGSTEAFGLLTDTNTDDEDTGINTGTGGVTSTRDLTIDTREILRAWEELARAHAAEFEIDDDGDFNFVPSLGSDKSSTITLTFRRDGQPGSNVDDLEIGGDGRPMANQIISTSTGGGGLTSTQDDAGSQTIYGLLIERKVFYEANDQTTLDEMTSSYLTQRAQPITDFRVVPTQASKKLNPVTGTRVLSGLQYTDVVVGDLVTVNIVTENTSISATKRIAEIAVEVDQNGQEQLHFTLSEATVFVTAAYLDATEVDELRRRVKELEALL